MTVSEFLARFGYSQSSFARAIGVEPRTVRYWVTGEREPSGPAKMIIASVVSGKLSLCGCPSGCEIHPRGSCQCHSCHSHRIERGR